MILPPQPERDPIEPLPDLVPWLGARLVEWKYWRDEVTMKFSNGWTLVFENKEPFKVIHETETTADAANTKT
jgi:hypothetical protein